MNLFTENLPEHDRACAAMAEAQERQAQARKDWIKALNDLGVAEAKMEGFKVGDKFTWGVHDLTLTSVTKFRHMPDANPSLTFSSPTCPQGVVFILGSFQVVDGVIHR